MQNIYLKDTVLKKFLILKKLYKNFINIFLILNLIVNANVNKEKNLNVLKTKKQKI